MKIEIKNIIIGILILAIAGCLHYGVKMSWQDIIMASAVILGPIIAVLITRKQDEERFKRERKLMIFRALMKDRKNQLSYDFVSAINLIQVEFYEHVEVMAMWKDLYEALNSTERPAKEDLNAWQRKFEDWNKKTTKLLYAISKTLAIPMEQLDIQDSYKPEAWGENENTGSELKKLLLSILKNIENKEPLFVALHNQNPSKK